MRLEATIGLEFEFSSHSDIRPMVRDRIEAEGYPVDSPTGYRHSRGDRWDLKTDSSCGWEIASPILRTYGDVVKAAGVADIISSLGGSANTNCGFHVHVGLGGHAFTETQIENIFRFLTRYEEAFFLMVPQYRRDSRWCKRIDQHTIDNRMKRGAYFTSNVWWQRTWPDKNVWLNGARFPDIGTLEFRLMPGTLDSKFVIGYIVFLQFVIKTVKDKTISWGKAKSSGPRPLLQTMLGQAGFYGPFTSEEQKKLAVIGRKWAIERFTAASSEVYTGAHHVDFTRSQVDVGPLASFIDQPTAGPSNTPARRRGVRVGRRPVISDQVQNQPADSVQYRAERNIHGEYVVEPVGSTGPADDVARYARRSTAVTNPATSTNLSSVSTAYVNINSADIDRSSIRSNMDQ